MEYLKERNKTSRLITSSVLVFSVIVTIIVFINSDKAAEGFNFLWVVPITYGLFFYITNLRRSLFKYLGVMIISLVMFVRYLILPLNSSLTGIYYHSFAPSTHYEQNLHATFLIIYEMLTIFLSLHYYVNLLNRQVNQKVEANQSLSDRYLTVYLLAAMIGMSSLMFIPEILARTNFLIVRDIEFLNLNAIKYFLFLFSANAFKVIFIIILTIQYNKKFKGCQISKITTVFFAVLSFGFFWTTNRMTVLAVAIATIALIINLNLLDRKLAVSLLLLPFITIIAMSTYRWFGYGSLLDNDIAGDLRKYLDMEQKMDYMLSYFASPHSISLATTIEFNPDLMDALRLFANEILSYIMFVNQIFPLSLNSTTVIYNKLFGFYWEPNFVLPMIGQSYMYFGVIFAPILPLFFTTIIYLTQKAALRTNSIGEKYAYYILLCWLGFFPVQNINIAASYIFNIFLPLLLIAKANKLYSGYVVNAASVQKN